MLNLSVELVLLKAALEANLRHADARIDAAVALIQEQVNELGKDLSKQLTAEMEEHRRVPHVSGQRLDDISKLLREAGISDEGE